MVIPLSILAIPIGYKLVRDKSYASIFVFVLTFLVVITPYFVWMYYVQESFLPVSSLAKYSREKEGYHQSLLTMTGNSAIGYLILLICIFFPIFSIFRFLKNFFASNSLLVVAISVSSIVYLLYVVFIAHEAYRWYLSYPLITSVFLLLYNIKGISSVKQSVVTRTIYLIPLIVIALNGFAFYKYYDYETVSSSLLKMTHLVNKIVPSGSRIGTHDAGIVGYFSTSAVHNLDGLINSKYNLDEYLGRGDVIGYVEHYNLEYLLLTEDRYASLKSISSKPSSNFMFTEIASFDVLRMAKVYLLKINN